MPFNNQIERSDAQALIPEDVSNAMLTEIAGTNPLLQMARKLPNMSRAQQRMPVLSALASAYFVSGDTGLKQTTDLAWANKYIDAEEIAAIVAIPQAVLDDADYDIWGQVKPELIQAFNKTIMQAILYGTNIPATWTTNLGAAGILAKCTAASSVLSAAAYTDVYEAVLGETAAGVAGVYMTVEADGYMVTGNLAHVSMKGKLRNCRDANGNAIFNTNPQDRTRYELDGAAIAFPTDGSIDVAQSLMFSGQWDQLVYSMRQDMQYKILDQAVISDAAGKIILNLAQQDMVALRATMRLGVALPNPINRMNTVEATRCPFSVLTA